MKMTNMKRCISILVFLALACIEIKAQTKDKIRVKAGDDLSAALSSYGVYRFPSFTNANISFKNGLNSTARLNYNLALGKMQFIDNKSDTLEIANPDDLLYIRFDSVLYYFNGDYLEVIADSNDYKLAFRQKIGISFEKLGAFDRPDPSADIKSYKTYASPNGSFVYDLKSNDDRIITRERSYYFIYKNENFFLTTKAHFLNVFSLHRSAVEQYIKENHINFNNLAELKNLFQFCIRL